jgi:Zn2+/Cd2+-exporting ATPase
MSKKEFVITGIDCAHCASKVELKVAEITGIKSVSFNFISKILSFEIIQGVSIAEKVFEVKQIISTVEPDSVISEKITTANNHNSIFSKVSTNKKSWFSLFTLSFTTGIIFFILGFIPILKPFSFFIFFTGYILIGGDIVLKAFKKVFRKSFFDENFLMTIATFGAFAIGEYSEAVGVLLFYKIGEFFQDKAVDSSKKSISSLLKLKSDEAFELMPDGTTKLVSAESIKKDTFLIIKPGSVIPVDSVIIEGNSNIDSSNITGESLPLFVEPGSSLLSGYINGSSVLKVMAVKDYSESTVAKILALVENSAGKKSKTENFITKFAQFYTPIVVVSALAIAFISPIILADSFDKWIYRALIFLVVSCPCALVISIPLSFFMAIGRAAKSGILIKGSCYLEALNSVKTVVFDKTGTITEGKFKVSEIIPEENISKEELYETASYAEFYSTHPIAVSIVEGFDKKINSDLIEKYSEIAGMGIIAKIKDDFIIAGNAKLLNRDNISFNKDNIFSTSVLIAKNGKYIGRIDMSDSLKYDTISSFKFLNSLGINTIVLTGDNFNSAQKAISSLEGTIFYSDLLPNEKVEIFEKIQLEQKYNSKVAFVGDGVNDAPVIARADVGFAMGIKGSDASIEAADIVLMTDEVAKVAKAIEIAHSTRKVVIQNVIFSLSVKFSVLILGIFGVSTMWEAVFADVGVAIIAILNAMRLIKIK